MDPSVVKALKQRRKKRKKRKSKKYKNRQEQGQQLVMFSNEIKKQNRNHSRQFTLNGKKGHKSGESMFFNKNNRGHSPSMSISALPPEMIQAMKNRKINQGKNLSREMKNLVSMEQIKDRRATRFQNNNNKNSKSIDIDSHSGRGYNINQNRKFSVNAKKRKTKRGFQSMQFILKE